MCSITETHFDCDEKHGHLMRTFQLAPAYPRPHDLNFIESIIWNFAPPWYEAFADGVQLPKSVTSSTSRYITGFNYDGRCIGLLHDLSDFASSNIYHQDRDYNHDRGNCRSKFEPYVIAVPKHLSKPFSPDEKAWMQNPPPRKIIGEFPKTPPKWRSSAAAALTLLIRSNHRACTRTSRTNAHTQPVDRFINSDIYDKNVWRIVLSFAIPPYRRRKRLLRVAHESHGSWVADLKWCNSTDGRFFAECKYEQEIATITVNGAQALQFRYPSYMSFEFEFAISDSYVALLFDDNTCIITSHTGEHISHFEMSDAVRRCFCAFTLHPNLPFIVVGSFSSVLLLDFQGNVFGCLGETKEFICPDQVIFDSVNELVMLLDGSRGIAFPLNNAEPFPFDVVRSPDPLPSNLSPALHAVSNFQTRITLHWSD